MSTLFKIVAAPAIFSQSVSRREPVLRRLFSTRASEDSRRVASCSRLISRENTATVLRTALATFSAIFSAKEVLPMPGRAARRIRSDLFSPEMAISTSGRPVDRPGTAESLAASSLSRSYTLRMTLEMWARPWADRPWRMA